MNKQKITLVVSVMLLIMVIAGVILYFVTSKPIPKVSMYHDPLSGETVVDNSQQTQSATDSRFPDKPTYLGFSKLVKYGLSNSQLDAVEISLYNYSLKQPTKFKEISIDLASLRQPETSDSSISAFEFAIKVNRSDNYFVHIEYTDTTTCVTKIYKSDKTTLLYTQ